MFQKLLCSCIAVSLASQAQGFPLFGEPTTATALLAGNVGISGAVQFDLLPSDSMGIQIDLKGIERAAGFGNYSYHIHTNPVGPDGDCMATKGHFDPNNAGSKPCDPDQPELCQAGDLSGKYGKISSSEDSVSMHIVDPFLKFSPSEQGIIGRSFVLHAPDSSRVACGNITSWSVEEVIQEGDSGLRSATMMASKAHKVILEWSSVNDQPQTGISDVVLPEGQPEPLDDSRNSLEEQAFEAEQNTMEAQQNPHEDPSAAGEIARKTIIQSNQLGNPNPPGFNFGLNL